MKTIQSKLIQDMNLAPHPEGGHYVRHYESKQRVPTPRGLRAASTAISYLLTGQEFSAFHRIKSDEIWTFHQGNTGIVIHELNHATGYTTRVLNKENPIFTVTANTWFAASLEDCKSDDNYVLCSCIVSPGFDFRDFEMATTQHLTQEFPEYHLILERYTREAPLAPIPSVAQKIVILTAMDIEADALVSSLNLHTLNHNRLESYGARCFSQELPHATITLICNPGSRTHANNIGTIAATQAATLALEAFEPDLMISAGVAGGYADAGAHIGDVFSATEVMLHGHEIPLESLKNFGQTIYPCSELQVLNKIPNLKYGRLSSGNQFLNSSQRASLPEERRAVIEDMEAGAIAQVLHSIQISNQLDTQLFTERSKHQKPCKFICLKSITNLTGVLSEQELAESNNFDANLSMAMNTLQQALHALINGLAHSNECPAMEI